MRLPWLSGRKARPYVEFAITNIFSVLTDVFFRCFFNKKKFFTFIFSLHPILSFHYRRNICCLYRKFLSMKSRRWRGGYLTLLGVKLMAKYVFIPAIWLWRRTRVGWLLTSSTTPMTMMRVCYRLWRYENFFYLISAAFSFRAETWRFVYHHRIGTPRLAHSSGITACNPSSSFFTNGFVSTMQGRSAATITP